MRETKGKSYSLKWVLEKQGRKSQSSIVRKITEPSQKTRNLNQRDVYVELPSELHRPGLVGKLNNTMYGTQDASNAWQKLWSEHLRSIGFELGASNPALYRSELVFGFCHGDDFVTAAAEDRIESFGKLLQEKFDTRRIGMIGAAEHLDKELEVIAQN